MCDLDITDDTEHYALEVLALLVKQYNENYVVHTSAVLEDVSTLLRRRDFRDFGRFVLKSTNDLLEDGYKDRIEFKKPKGYKNIK